MQMIKCFHFDIFHNDENDFVVSMMYVWGIMSSNGDGVLTKVNGTLNSDKY